MPVQCDSTLFSSSKKSILQYLFSAELIAAMDKVSVSRAVKTLVERGLVVQAERESDRRSRDLHLTEAGRRTYREIMPVALDAEADLLTGLDDAEIAKLAQMLDVLRQRAAELLADGNG